MGTKKRLRSPELAGPPAVCTLHSKVCNEHIAHMLLYNARRSAQWFYEWNLIDLWSHQLGLTIWTQWPGYVVDERER